MFESQWRRRFGGANAERMDLEFWTTMVRNHEEARLHDSYAEESEEAAAESLGCTPTSVRRFFERQGAPPQKSIWAAVRRVFQPQGDGFLAPIWTFDRMGTTRSPLPDGRVIHVAGEHEDHYDPDFCIYNDVVVLDLDGSIEIYGYPREIFPPTDFHTATPVDDRLILIGGLGYHEERRPGTTPVFALDLNSYRINPLPSIGEAPGWIFEHEAERSDDAITIWGGQTQELRDGEPHFRRNFDDFAYDLATGAWKRLTNRQWQQFEIQAPGGKAFMKRPPSFAEELSEIFATLDDVFLYVTPEALAPRSIPFIILEREDFAPEDRLLVEGFPVSIKMLGRGIEIVIEGDMDAARAEALADEIRRNVEQEIQSTCILKRLA